jgi:Tfp pilus assembly protein PilW
MQKAMMKKLIKNQNGITLIELMIASVIALIVLGGSIYVFTTQQSLLKDQNDNTKVRAKGRLAIKILAREIRMAGFGMPPGLGITTINSPVDSIQYRTNLNDVRTFMNVSTSGIGPSDSKVLNVMDGSEFASNDNIVVYNPAYNDSDFITVTSASSTSIGFSETLDNEYRFGVNAKVIYVNKYNEITLKLNGNQITKEWDGEGEVTIINNIAASGLEFDFYDELGNVTTDLAAIRRVGITLQMLDPDNPDAEIEFKTDVTIRNSTPKT